MRAYLDLMQRILDNGIEQQDRTGVGTLSVFGHQMRFDLSKGFPLLTTKKLHVRSIIIELLWFLRGDTNVKWLQDRKVSIWNEWADESGDLGPVYGKQWRHWNGADGVTVDQIAQLVDQINTNPASRRQIVTAWNPGRDRSDGSRSLPLPFSDPCCEWQAEPPALPKIVRRVSGRAV